MDLTDREAQKEQAEPPNESETSSCACSSKELLEALETQFNLAFVDAPLGMVLATTGGELVNVNKSFLRTTGYTREELLGLNSDHITHPDDIAATRAHYRALVQGTQNTGTMEKRYVKKNGDVVWARVSSSLHRNSAGTPTQLIAMVEDITDRKQAEERLRAIYDGTYDHIGLLSPDGTILEANRASLSFAGIARDELIGRPFWQGPWFAYAPGAPEKIRQAVLRASAGELVRLETTLIRPSGESLIFDISLHPVLNAEGEVRLIVPEGRDITSLKQYERSNEFLVRLDDLVRPLTDPHQIVKAAARLLTGHLQASRSAYAEMEDDEDHYSVTGDFHEGMHSIEDRHALSELGPRLRESLRAGQVFVLHDSETDPIISDSAQVLRRYGVRAFICVPILKSGRLRATFAVHQQMPRQWRQDEVELVQMVAGRCWESIERVLVSRELAEREQRFRFLAETIPQMLWTAAPDGALNFLSGQGFAYLGIDEEELFGSGWLSTVHEEDRDIAIADWTRALESSSPYETSYRLRRRDGAWRWHLVRGVPMLRGGRVVQWYGTCTDIEDRKQAEADLQRQWQTFDTALSHSPDYTYILDLAGRFTYANEPLLKFCARTYDDVLGKNLADLGFSDTIVANFGAQIQQVIQTGQPVRGHMPFAGAGDQIREYEHILVPVKNSQGRVTAVTGSSRDITQQLKAQELIQQDRRRWQELLLRAPAAVAVVRGPDLIFEWLNLDFLALTGRSAEDQLLHRSTREAVPELESQGYLALLESVYRTGEPRTAHEAPVRLGVPGNLREIFINFACLPNRNINGEVEGVFIHAVDVTPLVKARKDVEESERQFRTMAETIPHLTWMARADGDIFWYNRRWYEYTGTTPAEMEGWGWQKVHDPAVLPRVIEQWNHAIGTGEPLDTTFPIRGADGTFRTFLTRVEPVKDAAGRVVRWFGTNTDITEQKRTEERLRRMNRDLEEFSYVASHDLQEPLRMVNIYSQLLLKAVGKPDARVVQFATFVEQGVTRMETLIRDLLSFSRTVHTDEMPVGSADLSVSLQEALAVLKSRIEEAGASIELPPHLPLVCGDSAQLAHVFQNLISNALKYRSQDRPPRIIIGFEIDAGHCTVSVKDNGIGFDQTYAESIFGLFKRLHKEAYPGTGIGLAICKRIVERYGGRMWAQGVPGEGATFWFSLKLFSA